MPAHGRLGDRLEGALEERADVEGQIARGEARRPGVRAVVRTVVWLTLTAVSLYLVAPSVLETVGSWRRLRELTPGWGAAMFIAQGASVVCLWLLQRIAMHRPPMLAVATSQLAGNAMAKIAPGGGAVGAALQYRLLVQAGVERPTAVAGLTASNLLTLGIVLALPVLSLPALARGAVDRGLLEATLGGLGIFVVLFAIGVTTLAFDRPLAWIGRVAQRIRNRLRRSRPPLRGLPSRLLRERDRILQTVDGRWIRALSAGVGRWAFDYLTLLAALAAVGSRPRPAVVLMAFCTAQLLAQLPLTPGGLGFVEAGLTGTLALAGVPAGSAVLAAFAYRLVSYWLQLPLGLVGAAVHRRRYVSSARTIAVDRQAPRA